MFKWHYCDIGLFIPLLLILLCNLIDGFCSMGEMDNIQHQRHCRKILIWINSLLALLFSWNLLRFEKVLRIFSLKFDPLRRIDYPSPSFLSLSLYNIQMVVHFVDGWCYFIYLFIFPFSQLIWQATRHKLKVSFAFWHCISGERPIAACTVHLSL